VNLTLICVSVGSIYTKQYCEWVWEIHPCISHTARASWNWYRVYFMCTKNKHVHYFMHFMCMKYSIIPYSSIIFRLLLHTDRLIKSSVSSRISSAIELTHTSLLCYFLQLRSRGCAFVQLMTKPGKYGLKCSAILIMNNGNRPPARMQICSRPGRETGNLFGVA